MIRTFHWPIAIEQTGDVTLAVLKASYGDGYEQAAAEGINNRSESSPISIIGDETKVKAIMDFLDWHGGWRRFQWTPPLGAPGLYKCEKYSRTPHGAGIYTVTATLEQAF